MHTYPSDREKCWYIGDRKRHESITRVHGDIGCVVMSGELTLLLVLF